MNPARVLVLGFGGAVAVGTLLLMLPQAAAPGVDVSWVDALFTATSAVCVTGLTVLNTASAWSPFGHAVILALIQLGGLGIMTVSSLVALLLGKRITLRERLIISEALQESELSGLVRLLRYVVVAVFTVEAAGALLLIAHLLPEMPLGRALWLGVFHAISAFNNAGFDLFGTSLESFAGDPFVLGVMALLVVLGGLGFHVLLELWQLRGPRRRPLSLHARVVLLASALLIALGTVGILALEWNNPRTLGPLGYRDKVMNALFLSVVSRTAGFNSVATGGLAAPTLLLVVMLMFIGASPGSTGGGIKTTTLAAVLATVRATLRGDGEPVLFRRRLERDVADRALALFVIALSVTVGLTMIMLVLEDYGFLALLFEVTSALGTVGLTTGITPDLSVPGRIVLVLGMFIGRVGPLTLVYALASRRRRQLIRYPEDRLSVG